jgi:hypothetical protein
MSILNKIMGTAQSAARSRGTSGRTTRQPARRTGMSRGTGLGRGVGMAKRPAPRRTGYGRTPTTAGGGLGGLIGGLLRRR